MASCQLLRRLSPILQSTSRALSAVTRSRVHASRQALITQSLASHVTAVRCMSSDVPLNIVKLQKEEDFQEIVLKSKTPVVVDFHALWCEPCKLLGPRLESIVGEEKGRVMMVKVDIDKNAELAMHFNVQAVPTVVGMKDGKIIKSFTGVKDVNEIRSFVQSLL